MKIALRKNHSSRVNIMCTQSIEIYALLHEIYALSFMNDISVKAFDRE